MTNDPKTSRGREDTKKSRTNKICQTTIAQKYFQCRRRERHGHIPAANIITPIQRHRRRLPDRVEQPNRVWVVWAVL